MQALLNCGKTLADPEKMLAGVDVDMVGKSLDKVVTTGGSRPFNPTFADVLMNSIVEKHGYIVKPEKGGFLSMDNLFCDPACSGVPYTNFMMITAEPDYHKSTDTPERLCREDLEKSVAILEEYLMRLCNADCGSACDIAHLVVQDCSKRLKEAAAEKRMRVLEESFAALGSVSRLVRYSSEEEKMGVEKTLERCRKELQVLYDGLEKKAFDYPAELPEEYRSTIPQKTVRGSFSTEKYMRDISAIPAGLLPEIHGWRASSWLENLFYFMDGKTTLGELYRLLHISDFPVGKEHFMEMVLFLERDGMIRFL